MQSHFQGRVALQLTTRQPGSSNGFRAPRERPKGVTGQTRLRTDRAVYQSALRAPRPVLSTALQQCFSMSASGLAGLERRGEPHSAAACGGDLHTPSGLINQPPLGAGLTVFGAGHLCLLWLAPGQLGDKRVAFPSLSSILWSLAHSTFQHIW